MNVISLMKFNNDCINQPGSVVYYCLKVIFGERAPVSEESHRKEEIPLVL